MALGLVRECVLLGGSLGGRIRVRIRVRVRVRDFFHIIYVFYVKYAFRPLFRGLARVIVYMY